MSLLATLQALIRIESLSGSEAGLEAYISNWLRGRGIPFHSVDRNIVVHLEGSSPSKRRCLILNGHMDTVAAEDLSLWRFPPVGPNSGVEHDGKVFGCGASDMKASLAVFLHLVAYYNQNPSSEDLIVSFVTEEETTGQGTLRFLEYFKSQHRADYDCVECIVGEPTNNAFIEVGCRGTAFVQLTIVTGTEHAARVVDPHKTSITLAQQALQRVAKLEATWREESIHPILGAASITPTACVTSSSSYNQTPASCVVRWDIRSIPEVQTQVYSCFHELLADLGAVELLCEPTPPSVISEDASIITAIRRSTGVQSVRPALGANDTCWFINEGIDAVCFGPGNKETIHKIDEFIEVSALQTGFELFSSIVDGSNS